MRYHADSILFGGNDHSFAFGEVVELFLDFQHVLFGKVMMVGESKRMDVAIDRR